MVNRIAFKFAYHTSAVHYQQFRTKLQFSVIRSPPDNQFPIRSCFVEQFI